VPRLDWLAGKVRLTRGVLLPVLAGALVLWAASHSNWKEWRAFFAFLAVGALLYLGTRLGRRNA